MYLALAVPFFMLPDMIRNSRTSPAANSGFEYRWWQYVPLVLMAVLPVVLVLKAGVLVNEYEPMHFLDLATKCEWISEFRLPGYPYFLSFALWLSGHDITGVAVVQALLLALAVLGGCVQRRIVDQDIGQQGA